MPSEKLLPYLLNFIHKNAPTEEEALKMEAILCRTRKNGTRRQPIIKVRIFQFFFQFSRPNWQPPVQQQTTNWW